MKSVTASSSLCVSLRSHNHWILIRLHSFVNLVAGTSTLGLKQQKYRWGLHMKCNSRRNQEGGEELIVFITSVDGSSVRFQPETARMSTCLCPRGVSSCRGRGVQPHHGSEVTARGSQWWSRVPSWPLAVGTALTGLCSRGCTPGSSLRVKGRLVSHLQIVHWVWADQQGSLCIQDFDSNWLLLADGNLLSVLSQC